MGKSSVVFRTSALVLALVTQAACATTQPASVQQPLRVMTYNIQYGNEGLDSVIATIRAQNPDIVGLQEVDVHWMERSRFVDQAALLAKGLGMEFRFAHIYRIPNADASKPPREFGVGVLSKYPIVSFTNHEIMRHSTQVPNAAPSPLPGFLEASIDVKGRRVRVFNVHLDFRRDPAVRTRQVADMISVMGDMNTPTLVLGDMNAPPNAPEVQPLFQLIRDTWQYSQGPGLTGPARNPRGKIDYVLASNHFSVKKTWVPQVYSSDHFPVVADLTMNIDVR